MHVNAEACTHGHACAGKNLDLQTRLFVRSHEFHASRRHVHTHTGVVWFHRFTETLNSSERAPRLSKPLCIFTHLQQLSAQLGEIIGGAVQMQLIFILHLVCLLPKCENISEVMWRTVFWLRAMTSCFLESSS